MERADAIVVASINDLTERHGFGPMVASRAPNFQSFSLKDDAGGLWVAEDAGEILGFAWSWVLRITLPMVLMSARDFGDWTRYLPRNPGFM